MVVSKRLNSNPILVNSSNDPIYWRGEECWCFWMGLENATIFQNSRFDLVKIWSPPQSLSHHWDKTPDIHSYSCRGSLVIVSSLFHHKLPCCKAEPEFWKGWWGKTVQVMAAKTQEEKGGSRDKKAPSWSHPQGPAVNQASPPKEKVSYKLPTGIIHWWAQHPMI